MMTFGDAAETEALLARRALTAMGLVVNDLPASPVKVRVKVPVSEPCVTSKTTVCFSFRKAMGLLPSNRL